jgi:adenylyltransferase/sulfurtransferase
MSVISIDTNELREMLASGEAELIDVREEYEYAEVRIKGAKLIPMSLLPLKVDEIDWSKKVILYCRTGGRSYMIASQLARSGREVYDLSGGIMEFVMTGQEDILEKGR